MAASAPRQRATALGAGPQDLSCSRAQAPLRQPELLALGGAAVVRQAGALGRRLVHVLPGSAYAGQGDGMDVIAGLCFCLMLRQTADSSACKHACNHI